MEKCKESLITTNEWNKIREKTDYPNLQTVKKGVLEQEVLLAKNFADIKSFRLNSNSQLEIDFEWFLTWRVKIAKFPHLIWCDGVIIQSLKRSDGFRFEIDARIWLGPESNVNVEFSCNMNGFVILSKKFDKLENYKLEIEYQKQKYCICKSY